MGLFSSSKPESPAVAVDGLSGDLKTDIKNGIAKELAVVNATELVNKITENCFDKCVQQPQSSLTAQQNGCIDQCMQRYMRSWNLMSKTYIERIQREK